MHGLEHNINGYILRILAAEIVFAYYNTRMKIFLFFAINCKLIMVPETSLIFLHVAVLGCD